MTARALAVLAVCCWSAAASAARDADVTPERYLVTLAPSAARHSFAGRETIELELAAPARTITLDAVGLAIGEARVHSGEVTLPATVSAAHDRVTLTLPTAVTGALRVELAWTGALADDLGGMFAATGGRRALFTHFEPSGARRVFPCFDTPAKRARFELTVEIDAADEAVSNTPIVERTPLPNRRQRVRFAETAPLPTYLVALAVGRFAALDTVAGTTPLRVIAPPEQLPLARFALDTAAALLPRFAAYFDRPYAFDKLDLVAVPAFAPGGMENAGAIFLRDDRMLVDPAHASPATTHAIALLVAHELAHQWLGDLVTPAAWTDLWLAEATATYVAHEIVAAWHPEWRPWDDLQPSIDEVMADDELPAAHPVRASDGGRALFDAIVYTKGAALLRMLAGWVGDDVVRDAFRRLVAAHAFGAVEADDLWAALDDAAPSPVSAIARRWFEERGHPTLLAHGSCDHGTLTLFVRRDRPQPAAPIPLYLRWPGGSRVVLLGDDEASVRVDGGERCPAWIDANAGRVGFYRVHYDPALAAALADAAEPALDPAERVGLASDAWLELADGAPLASYLALATRLRGDRAPPVLDELGRRLSFISAELVRASERSSFERFVDELLEPAHAALGWRAGSDDDDATLLGRARAVELLGTIARTPRILAEADRQLRRYLADPAAVDGAMADAVVALGAQDGDAARFDAYLQHLHTARTPDVEERFRDALTRFERPQLLHRALALMLTGVVPAQELMRFCADLADNVRGRPTAWRFLKSHFDALERKSPRTGWLLPTTQRFCDASAAREIARFFAEREPYVSPASAVAETTERIASCAVLRRRAGAELSDWLRARYAEARKGGRR